MSEDGWACRWEPEGSRHSRPQNWGPQGRVKSSMLTKRKPVKEETGWLRNLYSGVPPIPACSPRGFQKPWEVAAHPGCEIAGAFPESIQNARKRKGSGLWKDRVPSQLRAQWGQGALDQVKGLLGGCTGSRPTSCQE